MVRENHRILTKSQENVRKRQGILSGDPCDTLFFIIEQVPNCRHFYIFGPEQILVLGHDCAISYLISLSKALGIMEGYFLVGNSCCIPWLTAHTSHDVWS